MALDSLTEMRFNVGSQALWRPLRAAITGRFKIGAMQTLVALAAVWLFTAVVIMVSGAWIPSSKEGWWALLVLGPPIYVIGHVLLEGVWNWAFSTPLMRWADQHPSRLLRAILHLLFFVLFSGVCIALVFGALWLWLRIRP